MSHSFSNSHFTSQLSECRRAKRNFCLWNFRYFIWKRNRRVWHDLYHLTHSFLFFLLLVPSEFLLSDFLNSSVFFSFILFLPTNETSPVSKKGKIAYGILVGFLSYVFIHVCKIVEGAYFSLAILNLFYSVWYLFYKIRQNSTKLSLYKQK